VLGIVNGVIRETVYKDRVGELTANQIPAGALIALLACPVSVAPALEQRAKLRVPGAKATRGRRTRGSPSSLRCSRPYGGL